MAELPREIRGVMVPVTDGRVLLPNATVAEVISYTTPDPIAGAPAWLLGRLSWRGWRLPLVSLPILTGRLADESRMNARVAVLNVVGPDGHYWQRGEPVVRGPQISVAVGELGPVGTYTVNYRVTSADGHPISGTAAFTLTQEGSGTPGAAADASAGSEDSDDSFLGDYGRLLLIVVAVLVFAGALAFALRKPKKQ